MHQAGIPQQSYYREYIHVANRGTRTTQHDVLGYRITCTASSYDYASKHGNSSNQMRWVYRYQVADGVDTCNYQTLTNWLWRRA